MTINRARLRMRLLEWMERLNAIDEAEGEAHRLFDDANSNLAYGNLSRERRDGYVKQTYRATGLHAGAMGMLRDMAEEMRGVVDELNEPAEQEG